METAADRHTAPVAPVVHVETGGRSASSLSAILSAASHARGDTRHEVARRGVERSHRRSPVRAKPVLASALALGLIGSGVAYARSANPAAAEPSTVVVGASVLAQTDVLARATSVDFSYRDVASVSRDNRRSALLAAGARDALKLEATQKAEAAKKAAAARAEAARKAAAAKAEAARVATEKAKEQALADARKDPRAVARRLMAGQGWTGTAQYGCLVNLWNGESGWQWSAENASSKAYGIPQSLPASKMAQFGDDYRTNPETQITWGLWYIKMSYGSPCNAWATWQARSPHWY